MTYQEKHKVACAALLQRINKYRTENDVGPVSFCKGAKAHVAALDRLEDGRAMPETLDRLEEHLEVCLADQTSSDQ